MALDSAQAEGLKRSAVWKVREGGMDEARGDIVAGLVPVGEEGLDSRQACCVQCTMYNDSMYEFTLSFDA